MPFIDPQGSVGTIQAPLPETAQSDRNFFTEIIPDAFRMENTVGSLMGYEAPIGQFDSDFNPMDLIPEDHSEYMNDYARAYNQEDFNRINAGITEELETKQRLSEDGGWGMSAMMAAGVLDPINLIPMAGAGYKAYRTGQVMKGALGGMGAGLGSTLLAETALQSTQFARTAEESAINIAAGTVFGGIVGGSIGAFKGMKAGKGIKSIEDVQRGFEGDVGQPFGNMDSVGAAAVRDFPDEVYREIEEAVDADIASGSINAASKGEEIAARTYDKVKELHGMEKNLAVDVALKIVGRQDPTLRLGESRSVIARKAGLDLVEYTTNRAGDELDIERVVPVERLIKNWQAPLYNALKSTDDLYTKYVTGHHKKFGSIVSIGVERKMGGHAGKMSHSEFKEAVGRAMRDGDSHDIPEVAEAAKFWRKTVFDPLKDRAIEAGVLPKDVSPEGAVSYFTRAYKNEMITQNRDKFDEILVNGLIRKQEDSVKRIDMFEQEQAILREDVAASKQEIGDIGGAVSTAIEKTAKEETNKAIDEVMGQVDAGEAVPTIKDPEQAAQAAASRAGRKKFREELEEDVSEGVKDAIEEVKDDAISGAISRIEEDPDVGAALKAEIAEPLPKAGAEGGLRNVDEAGLARAGDEAAIAAGKAFDRSFKAQLKQAKELALDPAKATAAVIAEVRAAVRKNVRNAAQKAAREATKVLREELHKKIKALSDRQKLHARDKFDASLERQELADMASQIRDRVTGIGGTRLPYDVNVGDITPSRKGTAGRASQLKQRSLTFVTDKELDEFLEHDVELIGRRLVRSLAPDAELALRLEGDLEGISLQNKIREDFEKIRKREVADAEKAGEKFDEARWEKDRESAISDVKALIERMRGVYGLPENPSSWVYRAGVAVRHLNYIRLLGGMTLSAIPDIARPVMIHGLARTWGDAIKPMIMEASQIAKQTSQMRDMGLATDMVMNSRAQAWASVSDDFARTTKFERGIGAMSDTFGMVSLMAPWNTAFKQISASMSHARIIRALRAEADGTITVAEKKYLRGNFIGPQAGKKILKQIDEFGDKSPEGMEFSNAQTWQDKEAYKVFQSALGRDTDRTIITPGQDIPLWASKSGWGLFFQFKSFAVASTQRMMLAGLQQRDAAAFNGLVLSIGLGMVSYMAKEAAAGREIDTDMNKLLMEGIDRSGAMGWLFEAHNTFEKVTGVGMARAFGTSQMSRYQSRNAIAALMGPSFGTAVAGISIMQSAFGEEDWSENDTQTVRRLLPYQNLFFLRQVIDKIEDNTNNFIGAQ